MAVTVSFHRLAVREYAAACHRYATQAPHMLPIFKNEVARAIQRIADGPDRWPRYGRNSRWVRTRRFPYLLYYRMLDADNAIIMAFAHGSRRLGYWRGRRMP